MFDLSMVFNLAWLLPIAFILYLLLEQVPSSTIKIILPTVCGIMLFLFVAVLNPQYETGFLVVAAYICGPLILPFFILVPLPVIEKKAGSSLGKIPVLSGMLITLVVFFLLSQNRFHDIRPQSADTLLWLVCLSVISSLVFFGIAHLRSSLKPPTEELPVNPEATKNNSPRDLFRKRVKIAALFTILILLCSPFVIIGYLQGFSTAAGFNVYSVDGAPAPNSTVIHLTDDNFREFPQMASIIRDDNPEKRNCVKFYDVQGSCLIGNGSYSLNEGPQFYKYENRNFEGSMDLSRDIYLEYNGEFYFMRETWRTGF